MAIIPKHLNTFEQAEENRQTILDLRKVMQHISVKMNSPGRLAAILSIKLAIQNLESVKNYDAPKFG